MFKHYVQGYAWAWGVTALLVLVPNRLVIGQAFDSTIERMRQQLADTEQRIEELQREARPHDFIIANFADFQAILTNVQRTEALRREGAGLSPEQLAARQTQIEALKERLMARRGEMFRLEAEALRVRVGELQHQVDDLQQQLRERRSVP